LVNIISFFFENLIFSWLFFRAEATGICILNLFEDASDLLLKFYNMTSLLIKEDKIISGDKYSITY